MLVCLFIRCFTDSNAPGLAAWGRGTSAEARPRVLSWLRAPREVSAFRKPSAWFSRGGGQVRVGDWDRAVTGRGRGGRFPAGATRPEPRAGLRSRDCGLRREHRARVPSNFRRFGPDGVPVGSRTAGAQRGRSGRSAAQGPRRTRRTRACPRRCPRAVGAAVQGPAPPRGAGSARPAVPGHTRALWPWRRSRGWGVDLLGSCGQGGARRLGSGVPSDTLVPLEHLGLPHFASQAPSAGRAGGRGHLDPMGARQGFWRSKGAAGS